MRLEWNKTSLINVCKLFTDGNWIESKDQSSNGIRLIQTGNVGNGLFKDRREKARWISAKTFQRLKCQEILPGDCLVSRLPDPVGRTCIVPETGDKMITAVDCSILRFDTSVLLPAFFNYYSQSQDYLAEVESKCTGATRKRISRKNLGILQIPLPPLPEQKRIVAILDEAFAAIDKAIANAEKNLANARELFESYLNNVFTQKGKGWVEKKLIQLTSKIGSGATPRGGQKSYKAEGLSLIRSLNVHDRRFRYDKLALIDEKQADGLSNVIVHEGDVLLNITGASIARCCVVPNDSLPARVNQHVSILRPKQGFVIPVFLNYLITSKEYKDRLLYTGEKAGATRQALTKTQLQDFVISIPSLDEQARIVRVIEDLESRSKHFDSLYQQKRIALTELKQSILQKAFSGELTAGTVQRKKSA